MVVSKNKLLIELINKQRTDVDPDKRLDIKDLHRICKNLNSSIFQKGDTCCLWYGYITNIANSNTKYINFFFKKKKYALHRLLYENFSDNINKSEYLRFTCDNKGICCNLNHIKKICKKDKKEKEEKDIVIKKNNIIANTEKKNTKNQTSIDVIKSKSKDNKDKLIIIF